MYNFNTKFDYDLLKSKSNLEKHGLSFEDAMQLWATQRVCEVRVRFATEERWMRTGQIGGKFYSCIYTLRGEAVRIISCRRSRVEEEKRWHEKAQKKN